MSPYQDGAKAYWQYKYLNDCPYHYLRYEWERGYTDARALDNGDIEYSPDHPAAEEHYK